MKKLQNKKTIIATLSAIFALAVAYYAWPATTLAPVKDQTAKQSETPARQASGPPAFDKNKYSISSAASLWAVVNKGRILPSDYIPAGLTAPSVPLRLSADADEMKLRQDAAEALQSMFSAAKNQGINLMLASGYRSYASQSAVYNAYAAQSGTAQADTFSARPGHSEHQTGLAADVEPVSRTCEVDQCFENTKEGVWLAANSYKYGFIIRYPKGKDNLTGYEYEPWHVRYVGDDLAAQLNTAGQTLEQFFGLPAFTSYPAQSTRLSE